MFKLNLQFFAAEFVEDPSVNIPPSLYIYNNDGSTRLHILSWGYAPFTVTNKGLISKLDETYIWEHSTNILGFATQANATEPTYSVGDNFNTALTNIYIIEDVEHHAVLIKNPIALIQSKVKKVVVDNVNLTIDVYTSEVPSEEPDVNLIKFYLDDGEDIGENSAVEGMTWGEWVESEYNKNWTIDSNGYIMTGNDNQFVGDEYNIMDKDDETGFKTYVTQHDIIVAGRTYYVSTYMPRPVPE